MSHLWKMKPTNNTLRNITILNGGALYDNKDESLYVIFPTVSSTVGFTEGKFGINVTTPNVKALNDNKEERSFCYLPKSFF